MCSEAKLTETPIADAYKQTIDYLYNSVPMFQQVGSSAYKEGMENSFAIDARLGYPHTKYKTIHVAGTNGKGSVSHLLASVLQEAGYKVGLYTSPHLLDFRERIRVNGEPISEAFVVNFVAKHKAFFESIQPSFFELTTGMAFAYFAEQQVDVAVIEVGLGGRLDCTNVITPVLSIITNISLDHTNLLGNTEEAIAREKAGIIKPNVPVVIGEADNPAVKNVFVGATLAAARKNAPVGATLAVAPQIVFADEGDRTFADKGDRKGRPNSALKGYAQERNTATVLCAIEILKNGIFNIPDKAVYDGFSRVIENTGLMGRWQIIQEHPTIIFDTGHNVGGMKYNVQQLQAQKAEKLHIVFGMVNDKDSSSVLALLPKEAIYYFTQASIPRALPATDLAEKAFKFTLKGNHYSTVAEAFEAAKLAASKKDVIFVGGSTFVVADALLSLRA
ncbi:MAG: bifunctional folylpolyglutamate synthase/dihydrofolate synthase [Candidatus Symbiothrix sp.]|nr:bifunctional folylpolyglutamate synthase/dihydrofolate synthase [Candidatus Symbiothrix sp.]